MSETQDVVDNCADNKALPQINSCKVVFPGSPIWWHTMASALALFIESFDLDKKTMVPFHTYGGGGVGEFDKDIAKMCRDSTVTKGFGTYNRGGSDTKTQIGAWLCDIELLII